MQTFNDASKAKEMQTTFIEKKVSIYVWYKCKCD